MTLKERFWAKDRDRAKWFSKEKIQAIKESKLSQRETAKFFNVSQSFVSNVKNNKVYAN